MRVQAEHCSQYELKCLPGLYQDQISLLTVTSNITGRGHYIQLEFRQSQVFSIYKQSDRNLETSKYQAIQSRDQKLLLENFLKLMVESRIVGGIPGTPNKNSVFF